jgi:serine/threonine protein kinase/HEAT repeat protein
MQTRPPLEAVSLSRRCPSCRELYPLNATHVCEAMAATLAERTTTADGQAEARAITATTQEEPAPAFGSTLDKPGPDDLIGVIVGERYEILARIDHGGMGIVYKARHTTLDKLLAVKILLRPQDEEAQRRFLLEAKLASKLSHPNTVQIVDFGVLTDGRSYLVMEFLTGPTLARALDKGRLDPLRACQIAVQIARGLCAVHSAGIVHRDLKPENIFLLEPDDQPDFIKIVDFGIAQEASPDGPGRVGPRIDPMGSTGEMPVPAVTDAHAPPIVEVPDSQRFTVPGTLLGTPLYMSPEQAQGLPTDVRSDQYALGCIMYEMLTGVVPFQVLKLSDLLERHIKTPPVPPRKRVYKLQLPEGVEELVLKLLEKKCEDRYPSMREVEQVLSEEIDLMLLERGVKVAVSRQTAARLSDPLLRARRRRRRVLLTSALLGLLAAGGASGYFYFKRRVVPEVKQELLPGELTRLRASAVATLIDLTRTTDPELRLPAITALGLTREEWLEPSLEELLSSPDSETQAQAATALGRLGAKSALPPLRALAERTRAPHVQVAIAAARLALGDTEADRELEAALSRADGDLAYHAALVICESPQSKPPDSDAERRQTRARTVLAERAARWDVPRPMAVELWARLAQCGDTGARDKLRAEVGSGEVLDVPLLAASKLAQLGDADGQTFLRRLTDRPEYGLRALRALAQAGVSVDAGQFRRVLEDRGGAVLTRVWAAQGLGYAGKSFDTRLLGGELASTSDPRLREALAIAILQLNEARRAGS